MVERVQTLNLEREMCRGRKPVTFTSKHLELFTPLVKEKKGKRILNPRKHSSREGQGRTRK
jgi:hypothetical protein